MKTFRSVQCFVAAALSLIGFNAIAQDNVAYKDDQVRVTVITDGVIRLEWQPEGKFEERCTEQGAMGILGRIYRYHPTDSAPALRDGTLYIYDGTQGL